MIKQITARVLLSKSKQPDPWFGIMYTMNLYRGCQHQCIYCDSRSECYQIENFADILVKANALDLLRKELPGKRTKGTIGTGSMNDPYMPLEAELNLTGQALQIIARHGFPVHVITKSDLVVRDIETLRQIAGVYAAVSFTITTSDDDLARKLEPGAPSPSRRFAAMRTLAHNGILTGVTLMPVLPFIEDSEDNIAAIMARAHDSGAGYVMPAFGLTMRDRQRAHFYTQLDRLFPGLRQRYEAAYGDRYSCGSPNAKRLTALFQELCTRYGITEKMPHYAPTQAVQQRLF